VNLEDSLPPDEDFNTPDPPVAPPRSVQAANYPPLREYCPSNPALWFKRVEIYFAYRGISSENRKFTEVIMRIPDNVMEEVEDVLDKVTDPSHRTPYSTLKKAIIDRVGLSTSERIRTLLEGLDLGQDRPSALLRKMKSNAPDCQNNKPLEDLLRELWLKKLPADIQMVLAALPAETTLDVLAQTADNVSQVHRSTGSVAAVSEASSIDARLDRVLELLEKTLRITHASRSSSSSSSRPFNRSRSRSQTPGRSKSNICRIHRKFGKEARYCIKPCSWQGNANAEK